MDRQLIDEELARRLMYAAMSHRLGESYARTARIHKDATVGDMWFMLAGICMELMDAAFKERFVDNNPQRQVQ